MVAPAWYLFVLCLTSVAAAQTGRATFAELARPVARPPGFPRASAVCFSSRWKHPSNAQDPHDSLRTAAAFHATGFYWAYTPSAEWLKEIRAQGYTVQGTVSTILPDTLFGGTRQRGRIVDAKGELVTGPWMRSWKGWWGCVNSPDWRKVYLDYVRMYLDSGVESIHMDDPGQNRTAVLWGGCYCPHCRDKAQRAGQSPRDIQAASTLEFYRDLRRAMDAYARRHVPFSCNSHSGLPEFLDEIFDWGLEELSEAHARPARFHRAVREAERRGKAQMYTYVSRDRRLTRAAIALAYACGTQVIVPWDVYIGTDLPRQFGAPEDYADLYGFARGIAERLDGYDEAAALLPRAAEVGDALPPLAVSGGSAELCLTVRAQAGRREAPVVIHAVDSAEQPRPFQLRVDPARLFGGRPVTVDLLRPAPYERSVHEQAERQHAYGPLVRRQRLAAGYTASLDVPALEPWGVLVIAPAPAAAGLQPPYVAADPASLGAEALVVRLDSIVPGATIRYTLDGTPVGAASAVYREPLRLTADTMVTAHTETPAGASAPVTVRYRRLARPAGAISPDALPGLRLWLRADDLPATTPAGGLVATWPARVGPAMVADGVRLHDGRPSTAPVLVADAIAGRPVVRFARETDLLRLPGFANQYLNRAFTLLVVSRSDDPAFGLCGNAANGNGGVPRLYLTRQSFTYHATSIGGGADPGTAALLTYAHDGQQTIDLRLDGQPAARGTGPAYALAGPFGAGGTLAMPAWLGNQPHRGEVAEVVAYDRRLSDTEQQAVEQYLAAKYRLPTPRGWE